MFRVCLPVFVLFSSLLLQQKSIAQDCKKQALLIRRLNEEHLMPQPLNDSLSNRIFNEVFLQFDPSKIFFHQGDINKLERYRFALDDELLNNKCVFVSEFKAIYQKKVERTMNRIDSILSKGLTFQEPEPWFFNSIKSSQFEKNDRALLKKILFDLKHDILGNALQRHRFNDTSQVTVKALNDLLPAAITETKTKLSETFHELLKEINNGNVFEATYLRALAKVYDPHSDYFTQVRKQEFDENLSDERLSLGIGIEEDDFGNVQVDNVVPGGPAWKSSQVHKGDKLMQIIWDDHAPVNLLDKDVEEIDELLYKAQGKQAKLTILKSSGEKVIIELTKEKIENTENSITGFVLTGKHRVGYIHLPGFFSDESTNRVNGCANEVAKEILKLNKLKIEGLIFDLRDNGGGSLQEAVDLAGIFVDAGPMSIISLKGEPPITVKDMNRGMAFTGPMVVLVNGHSASASELVAAALQDYNRAVIVGSQTFGKATGQEVLPLTKGSEADFIKVTKSRLYRLTQKSLQQIGVVPDIILPEAGAPLRQSERSFRYSLVSQSIEKKTYYNVLPLFYFEPWINESRKRVESNQNFIAISTTNQMLMQAVPLKVDDFALYSNTLDTHFDSMTKAFNLAPYTVNTSEGFSNILDAYRKPSESLIKEISTNPYIQEAFHIMCDIIKTKK